MEILANFLAGQTGIECIIFRFGEIYGPLNHWKSMPSILAQAAVKGENPDLKNVLSGINAQDGSDRCYVKDAARAVALLQLASTLHHRVYNIATGRPTNNQDLVKAIKEVLPEAELQLPSEGVGTVSETSYLDNTWLVEDTDYQPSLVPLRVWPIISPGYRQATKIRQIISLLLAHETIYFCIDLSSN
jgi:UDP-glucose 4-epimerase